MESAEPVAPAPPDVPPAPAPAPAPAPVLSPPADALEAFSPAEVLSIGQILFSFRGRLPRRAWWLWGIVAVLGCGLFGLMLLRIAGASPEVAEGLVNLLALWPALAISVKRWHDRDKSGWWVLINLLPVIGTVWVLVENGLLRGTPGPNRYGEDLTGRV